jgi:hypothetical protein
MTKRWVLGAVVVLAGCQAATGGSNEIAEVRIQGADYAFVGVPETLPAGRTAFSYQNIGKVRHEMGIERLVAGRTLVDVMEAEAKKIPDDSLYGGAAGILITKPGETAPGKILIDLEPGRTYVLWCDFRDSANAKRHSDMGMIGAFTVR